MCAAVPTNSFDWWYDLFYILSNICLAYFWVLCVATTWRQVMIRLSALDSDWAMHLVCVLVQVSFGHYCYFGGRSTSSNWIVSIPVMFSIWAQSHILSGTYVRNGGIYASIVGVRMLEEGDASMSSDVSSGRRISTLVVVAEKRQRHLLPRVDSCVVCRVSVDRGRLVFSVVGSLKFCFLWYCIMIAERVLLLSWN